MLRKERTASPLGLLAVLLVLSCVPAIASASSAPENGGFEITDGAMAVGWSAVGLEEGKITGGVTDSEKHSGKYSFKITKENESGVGALYTPDASHVTILPGKDYEIGVYFKTSGSCSIRFMLTQALPDGSWIQPFIDSQEWSGNGDWQKAAFRFKTDSQAAKLRIHILTKGVGDVFLDDVDLQVIGLIRNPDLKEFVELPKRVDAKISFEEGRPRLKVDGERIFEDFFITVPRPGVASFEVVPDVIKAGYRVILIPIYAVQDGLWKAENEYDWKSLDERLGAIRFMGPGSDQRVMLYLALAPPASWMKAHFQERTVYDNESPGEIKAGGELQMHGLLVPSFASEVYIKSMETFLEALIKHIDTQPYRNMVIGYHVGGGYDGQWFYNGLNFDKLPDYSEPMRQYFIRHLRKKYGNDVKQLQAAWRNPQLGFDAVTIPSRKQRFDGGVLRNPSTQQDVLDYMEAHAQAPIDFIKRLAHTVKRASDGRALFSVYGGGIVMDTCKSTQATGRIFLKELLECPDVDCIANVTYFQRPLSEPGGLGSVMASYRLHGKLAIHEQDIRTYLTKEDIARKEPLWGFTPDWEHQKSMLIREFGWVLGTGGATWQYDMAGGWYSAPEFWNLFSQFQKIGAEQTKYRYKSVAQMAVVVDDVSMIYPQDNDLLVFNAVTMQRTPLGWMGAPYDVYLMSDLLRSDVPKYKCYFFLNCYRVDSPMRQRLHNLLREARATAIWLYAPGIISDGNLSEENVEKLTGFRVKRVDGLGPETEVTIRNGAHPVIQGLGETRYGTPRAIGSTQPAFSGNTFYLPQESEGVTVLGDIESVKQPGLAVRNMDGWTSIYSSVLVLTPQLLRNIFASAGGFLYVDDAATGICATDRILSVFSKNAGMRKVKLPKPAVLRDLFTGEQLGAGKEFQIPFKEHEARLFSLEPKE